MEQEIFVSVGKRNSLKIGNSGYSVICHAISVFLSPIALCSEIERTMNAFWWGKKSQWQETCWTAWNRLCGCKKKGRIGFRRMQNFNIAMVARKEGCGWDFSPNPSH